MDLWLDLIFSDFIFRGGFMMIYDHKTKKSEVVDFRETAPAAANIDFFKGKKSLVQKVSIHVFTNQH